MRPTRLLATLALAAASFCVAGPAALAADHHNKGAARIHVQVDDVSCVGDTLSGTVGGSGPAGSVLTVRLVGLGSPDHRVRSGASSSLTLPLPAGGASVHFDVAGIQAQAYRVVVDAVDKRVGQSRAVPAGSCAPGHEVPEAPLALLAPLTMLGAVALVGARRLRPTRTAA